MSPPATLYTYDLASLGITSAEVDSDSLAIPNARDLAYDHQTGTFLRGANGGRYFTSGLAGVRQAINIKLLTFLGEWFLDTTRGVPHFELILVKAPNFAAIQAELTDQILAVKGVKSITSVTVTFDRATRTLHATYKADTIFGVVTGSI